MFLLIYGMLKDNTMFCSLKLLWTVKEKDNKVVLNKCVRLFLKFSFLLFDFAMCISK